MRLNQKIGVYERALLSVKTNKKLKNKFWDSDWQSIQGKKGGIKGGSANTFNQYKARQKVGLNYGFGLNTENHKIIRKRGGLKNSNKQKIARSKVGISQQTPQQTPQLKKLLSKSTIWAYKKQGQIIKIYLSPQESVVHILKNLKTEIPNLNKCKNANNNIYNIINGRTSKMFIQKCSIGAEILSLFLIIL